ncbi:cytochrome P450 4C1 [Halyomorpha halys]|uniref:cytochrome P450 4C1 n=1 Tax=Halyomorpha halys TaxID=286706 RepID=UPI0006D52530|nr:cytochrome P450 4C1-like [Halyomorpha halys]
MLLFLLSLAAIFIVWWMFIPPYEFIKVGNSIPGPRAYPVLGNLLNFKFTGPSALKHWEHYTKIYGNTFRVWLGPHLQIFTIEPEDIQVIFSSKITTKSNSYKALECWLGTGLLISNGNLWHQRRKAITPTFHFKILESFVPIFYKCGMTLVNCLKEKVGKTPFDITPYMSNCALDVVAETAMGTEVKAQTNPQDEYPKSVLRMTKLLGDKMYNPYLNILEPIYILLGKRKEEADLLKVLFTLPLELLKRKVNEKNNCSKSPKNGGKKNIAFLELLAKIKETNNPAFKTDQDIKDEVVTFMFEGHDTSTMALSYTLWLLGLHPEIQEALFQEVSQTLAGKIPLMEDYQKMDLLNRVLKESLRLYSPIPLVSRMITEEMVLPGSGYRLPVGTQVVVSMYALHRRADLFPEPEKFNPDRFLKPIKHPFAYVPFAAGPRNCIGQKFVMLELKVIVSLVVLNFKIHSINKNLKLTREILLRCLNGPHITLTSRK